MCVCFVCLYLYGLKTCCKHGFELYISFLLPLKSLTDAIRFMTSADPFLSVCPCMFSFSWLSFYVNWILCIFIALCSSCLLLSSYLSNTSKRSNANYIIRIIITNFCSFFFFFLHIPKLSYEVVFKEYTEGKQIQNKSIIEMRENTPNLNVLLNRPWGRPWFRHAENTTKMQNDQKGTK